MSIPVAAALAAVYTPYLVRGALSVSADLVVSGLLLTTQKGLCRLRDAFGPAADPPATTETLLLLQDRCPLCQHTLAPGGPMPLARSASEPAGLALAHLPSFSNTVVTYAMSPVVSETVTLTSLPSTPSLAGSTILDLSDFDWRTTTQPDCTPSAPPLSEVDPMALSFEEEELRLLPARPEDEEAVLVPPPRAESPWEFFRWR